MIERPENREDSVVKLEGPTMEESYKWFRAIGHSISLSKYL